MQHNGKEVVRVFPRKAKWVPGDDTAFVGDPPPFILPEADEVHVSCTFTWDKRECERLADRWSKYYKTVLIGGPAYDDPGLSFTSGVYIRKGYVITSRGCPHHCAFCFVPKREGPLRTLPVVDGWNIEDNNLLACPKSHIESVLKMLSRQPEKAKFTGGFESALVDEWVANHLKHTIRLSNLYLAYDRESQADALRFAVGNLKNAGIGRGAIRCYVMVGFPGDTIEKAECRLRFAFSVGTTPFAMYYRPITDVEWYTPPDGWNQLCKNWIFDRAIFARMKREGMYAAK